MDETQQRLTAFGKLGIGAPTVSHHLKELSGAGLIETEKNGKFLVARVNRKLLADLCETLDLETAAKRH